ncbi:hypothetical protein ACFX15_009162 [Malus domestica]
MGSHNNQEQEHTDPSPHRPRSHVNCNPTGNTGVDFRQYDQDQIDSNPSPCDSGDPSTYCQERSLKIWMITKSGIGFDLEKCERNREAFRRKRR